MSEVIFDIRECYTHKPNKTTGEFIVTGYDPKQLIQVGSTLILHTINSRIEFIVLAITRRNHAGNFNDERNRVNSHYTATIKKKIL